MIALSAFFVLPGGRWFHARRTVQIRRIFHRKWVAVDVNPYEYATATIKNRRVPRRQGWRITNFAPSPLRVVWLDFTPAPRS